MLGKISTFTPPSLPSPQLEHPMSPENRAKNPTASHATTPPIRTKFGLMAEIMAAASGQPIARVRQILADFRDMNVPPGKGDQLMSESEYQEKRAQMMGELPGILNWMMREAASANADPKVIAELRFRDAHRN
jgi:hypothetical protein